MLLRSSKILHAIYISMLLISLFTPLYSQAQTADTTTDQIVSNPPESVVQTTSVDNSNEVLPATEPPAGSAGGSILGNLGWFGGAIGMSAVDPRTILARIIRSGLSFVGIIVLLLILWSGLSYMTAGGDEEKAKNARSTFVNTLIGLFIILAAYSIVSFVINAVTGSTGTAEQTALPANQTTPDPVVNP